MQIKTQMIEFPSNGQTTPAYFASPDSTGTFPGLIVIQEWWGLVPHIKDVADRFAREGFVALAPDLYHGQATTEPDEARKLAMKLDREKAVQEILAGMRYLQQHPVVIPSRIGVVGWCMGGFLTIATAAASPDLGAAVVFYGSPPDRPSVARIQAPLLGLFAESDHGIPVEHVHEFADQLAQTAIPHEIHIYPGTQHAFFNDTRPHIYHPEAAADAWGKTLAWFRKYLV